MRWKQRINDDGTSRFEAIDEAATRADSGSTSTVRGDIASFVSPIDGSVISGRKQLRDHNKRHGVVNSAEFSPEFFERKAKERQDFFEGKHSKQETHKRKSELYETWVAAERN